MIPRTKNVANEHGKDEDEPEEIVNQGGKPREMESEEDILHSNLISTPLHPSTC